MFTDQNTEGFSASTLAILNAALTIRLACGEDIKNASDAINNAWVEDFQRGVQLGWWDADGNPIEQAGCVFTGILDRLEE